MTSHTAHRTSAEMTDEEIAVLREQIAWARLTVRLDKNRKLVTDPRIVALAAMEKPSRHGRETTQM
ncbi:hypothetical protein SAMN05216554_0892 [Herbiconiux ginsengi]|uniref:Uncharacterized protein n=2 Tax=Herbiconiux ginsengi TaxID=381665 RepID=A0A1H3LBD4_9MICO|nr:hypothetical protein SAMN05216554_0892 [Herbiconiux ginsengi]